MIFVGILAAIAVGLTTPFNNIVFGDLTDVKNSLIIKKKSFTKKNKNISRL